MASGDQIFSIALAFRVGESTARGIINETCLVIGKVLTPRFLNPPTEDSWRNISLGFLTEWNLPNCIGSLDGKHFIIQAPANSGAVYFN